MWRTRQAGQLLQRGLHRQVQSSLAQPAVAAEIADELLGGDPSRQISETHVAEAIERIVMRRDTHVDSLLQRLQEERVRKVVEPMILGESPIVNHHGQ